jgi:hypothetical protein
VNQLIVLMNQGGTLGWAVAVVGAFGVLLALFVLFGSVLTAPSKVVRFLSMSCLFLSLGTSITGIACTLLGRSASERMAMGKRPAMAERIQQKGFVEARSGVTLAVPLAAPPILLALLGLVVASRRRWTEFHEEPPAGLTLAVVLFLLDGAAVAGSVFLYRQPAPGRELDDDGWRVRELTDALDANEWLRCLDTKWELPAGSPAQGMGAHLDNQRRCVEHFATEGKVEDLKALAELKWIDDPKVKTQLSEKISERDQAKPAQAAAASPSPSPAAPPPPSADIAQVQAKARACFEKAAKKKKNLTVATALAIDVAADGKVLAVKDTGTGKPDAVRKCAVASAKALKLKAGDARKLDVPLSFP